LAGKQKCAAIVRSRISLPLLRLSIRDKFSVALAADPPQPPGSIRAVSDTGHGNHGNVRQIAGISCQHNLLCLELSRQYYKYLDWEGRYQHNLKTQPKSPHPNQKKKKIAFC